MKIWNIVLHIRHRVHMWSFNQWVDIYWAGGQHYGDPLRCAQELTSLNDTYNIHRKGKEAWQFRYVIFARRILIEIFINSFIIKRNGTVKLYRKCVWYTFFFLQSNLELPGNPLFVVTEAYIIRKDDLNADKNFFFCNDILLAKTGNMNQVEVKNVIDIQHARNTHLLLVKIYYVLSFIDSRKTE